MKILVVRYRFIGDMVLTIPFLRNLRTAYPDARIDMLVAPNSGEILENIPYVDNFIFFDTTRKHKYENGENEKKSFWYYVNLLKKEEYDKAYVLKRSLSSALLVFFAGIKKRIGFNTEGRGLFLTKRVKYDTVKNEALCFLDVLEADGIEVKDTYTENFTSEKNDKKISEIFLQNDISASDKKVIVHATASNDYKTWDRENFVKIIEYIINEKNAKVIFTGALCDKSVYETMTYSQKLKNLPLNLCGELTLQESLSCIKACDLLIGNDSGNLHMASSVGTNVIGIYGPMPFEKWKVAGDGNILFKPDLECVPCGLKKKCRHKKACLRSITPDMVKSAIDRFL